MDQTTDNVHLSQTKKRKDNVHLSQKKEKE